MEETRDELSLLEATLPAKPLGRGGFFGRRPRLLVGLFAVLGLTVFPMGVGATTLGGGVAFVVGSLFHILVGLVGQLLLLLVGALIWIAQYNGFVDSTAVTTGWVIVRDVANMFFIVALLIIAFGTILGFSSYHYSGTLPRLVIMAIVVNFSRTICGLIIDFSQVIMMTFVNGFKEAAGGNFINSFGLANLLNVSPSDNPDGEEDLLWTVTLSLILAFLLVTIAAGVVVIMIAVLVVRIVYLWLLVVLSPLAFVASATPVSKASSFYGKWWELFNKQVMVGPLMAFFLWLALISVNDAGGQVFAGASATTDSLGGTAATSFAQNDVADTIQKFIIAIGMLLGGVSMAQEMSGAAVGAGKRALKGAGRFAGRASKWAAGTAYRVSGADRAVDKAKEMTYTGLGKTRIPLASSYFRKQARLQRKTMASKSAADDEGIGYLSDKELQQQVDAPVISNKGLGDRKAAIKEQLRRAGDPSSEFEFKSKDKYHKLRKEAERLGDSTYDTSMKSDFTDFGKKHPSYIVDKDANEKDKEKQIKLYNAVWSKRSSKDLVDTKKEDYESQGLMQAPAANISSAYSSMGGPQAEAMMKALGFDDDEMQEFADIKSTSLEGRQKRLDMIRDKQNELKARPENFEYLSEDQIKSQIVSTSKGGQDGKQTVTNVDVQRLGEMGVEGISKLPSGVYKDKNVARGIGDELSSDDIRKLPNAIGDEVRKALLAAGNDDKFMRAGGKLETMLPELNVKTGNISDDAGRQRFNEWMSRGPASDRVGLVSPELLTKNGGNNDVAIAAAGRMSAAGLQKMAEGKDKAQAAAMTQALSHLARMSDAPKGSDLSVAQAKARSIMSEAERKGSSLQASLKGATFENRAGRKIKVVLDGADKFGRDLPGNLDQAVSRSLSRVGKAADDLPGQVRKRVDESVKRSLSRAARRAESLGGRMGARRRRLF